MFKGIAEFATDAPEIITGDNYEQRRAPCSTSLVRCKINIFNIAKISAEVRGGKSPASSGCRSTSAKPLRISGQPAGPGDADGRIHRYRATAGMRAINELKPVLGLELTATPFVETSKGPSPSGT